MTNIYEASSTAAHGLTRRETFAWSASIRLGEDFVELRVAPEACSVDGFRHGGCRRLLIFLPETRKTERIPIAREGDTDLPVKESAEVFSAHAALCGKVLHVLVPAGLSQDTQGLLHRGMYQDTPWCGASGRRRRARAPYAAPYRGRPRYAADPHNR